MNVGDEHKMYINTINVGGSDARVTMDITNNNGISNGIISWNPSSSGIYYYDCSNHPLVMNGKIIIGNLPSSDTNISATTYAALPGSETNNGETNNYNSNNN